MNKANYSQTMISTFEIIACYFVDIFYNHLYLNAQDSHRIHGSKTSSLTEEYKKAIRAYEYGIRKDNKYYQKTIKGVLDYYRTYTRFSTIGLAEFIDRVLGQFLPEEHFSVLTDQEKEFFLNQIITNLITEFTTAVLDIKMLKSVIDNHWSDHNTRKWIDKFVDIQILEHEKLFKNFLRQVTRKSPNYVESDVAEKLREDRDKLWEQVQQLLGQKCSLEAELAKAKKIVEKLFSELKSRKELESGNDDKLQKLAEDNNELAEKNRQILDENSQLRAEIDNLREQLDYLRADAPAEETISETLAEDTHEPTEDDDLRNNSTPGGSSRRKRKQNTDNNIAEEFTMLEE